MFNEKLIGEKFFLRLRAVIRASLLLFRWNQFRSDSFCREPPQEVASCHREVNSAITGKKNGRE